MNRRRRLAPGATGLALLLLLVCPSAARAQGAPNVCDAPGDYPDVAVGDIHELTRYGSLDGVTAFSIGTTSCNVGTCWLNWIDDTPDHPVIGQNAFRLKDGRFEQVGQSWLKHGFFAVSESLCFNDCQATNGDHLGVHCSDPYSSFFNGWQQQLGPKSEVNPTTGRFPYPYSSQGVSGNAIFKRLQIKNVDLDPALNAGAQYFVEAQYVAADDSAAGRESNNLSYRPVTVVGGGAFLDLFLSESLPMVPGPGIQAWSDADAEVQSVTIPSPGDGRYIAAVKVTDLGGGRYRYEYAIQNVDSASGARALTVPLPWGATATQAGFHDVDYHSGEPYDGTDWPAAIDSGPDLGAISWSTAAADQDPLANALRWGTLYNFRFEVDAAPAPGRLTLELFDSGGASLDFVLPAPALCDNDGTCDPGEECSGCPTDCGAPGELCCGDGQCVPGEDSCSCGADCGAAPAHEVDDACVGGDDEDCDGLVDCADPDCCAESACDDTIDEDGDGYTTCDCDDGDGEVWNAPGEVQNLLLDRDPSGTILAWAAPIEAGAAGVVYDAVRSGAPDGFMKAATCVVSDAAAALALDTDPEPGEGSGYFYLIRAQNGCPQGEGPLGTASGNQRRTARNCP